MSPHLLPRRQLWIADFTFLFLSVRNLKEVYEQVNLLKLALFKSPSTSARGNRP